MTTIIFKNEINEIKDNFAEMNTLCFNLCDELLHALIEMEIRVEKMEQMLEYYNMNEPMLRIV